jgi:elongation factor Ts
MEITTELIKELRDKTGVSVMQCKKALEEAGGDMQKAEAVLLAKSSADALKKADRTLGAGSVESYIHSTHTLGAMVELLAETDFVAKNEEFRQLAKDLAMHVTAGAPENEAELLEQPFVKDGNLLVKDVINQAIQKFGEKIAVGKFVRFSI